MRATEELLDRHLDCFGRGDLDGIVADYSPAAVMFTPGGPLNGPAAIRSLFQAIFTEFGNLARRFPYSCGASTATTPTFSGAPLDRRGGPVFSRSEARLPAESRQLDSRESRRTSSQRQPAPG